MFFIHEANYGSLCDPQGPKHSEIKFPEQCGKYENFEKDVSDKVLPAFGY